MEKREFWVNIVGAGLAGLSAAWTLAGAGVRVRLISYQESERAQSNLAEGGINGVLNTMGEDDEVRLHFEDTMKGGVNLADPNMVRNLTQDAPEIIRMMDALGVPFHRENGRIVQRSFGGQRKKRTAYAKSSTGKVLTGALIDAVRRYEAEGQIIRYPHHQFERLLLSDSHTSGKAEERVSVCGVQIMDRFTGERLYLDGPVVMACGGMNGMFRGATTGTSANTGQAAAILFTQGVKLANLEFLQYHPTTVRITGKRLLISEAARGEGGRLFCRKEGSAEISDHTISDPGNREDRCYFMEEKYGERGNLMPRDVISREMAQLGRQVFLDLSDLSEQTWNVKLSDLRAEVMDYTGIDPKLEPVPVSPGIHYFMGGIFVDEDHRTNLPGLYAAGECACAYHGANRLGGNSLLGAIYGGKRAAGTVIREADVPGATGRQGPSGQQRLSGSTGITASCGMTDEEKQMQERMTEILLDGMGVLRDFERMNRALEKIRSLKVSGQSETLRAELLLSEAILMSAISRKESRGAHTRLDCPETKEEFRKTTVVRLVNGKPEIGYEEIPHG